MRLTRPLNSWLFGLAALNLAPETRPSCPNYPNLARVLRQLLGLALYC